MFELQDIEAIYSCNIGGGTRVELTSLTNLNVDGSFNELNQVYDIFFRRNTVAFSEKSRLSRAGNSSAQDVKFFIPKKRASVEHLIRTLYNKISVIRVTDRNGDIHIIYGARMAYQYTTGEKHSSNNGYQFKFTGKTVKNPFQLGMTTTLLGDNGASGGSDGGGGSEPSSGDPTSIEECCITINPVQLSYNPAPSGNVDNHNEVVTGQDGNVYFIDKNGASIILKDAPYRQSVTGTGTSFSLDAELQSLPFEKILITRNGVVIHHTPTPSDINDYQLSGNTITLPTDWPLDASEQLYIYKL